MFNINTVKVNYYCMQNVASITNTHNKKLVNIDTRRIPPINCRKKDEWGTPALTWYIVKSDILP